MLVIMSTTGCAQKLSKTVKTLVAHFLKTLGQTPFHAVEQTLPKFFLMSVTKEKFSREKFQTYQYSTREMTSYMLQDAVSVVT